MQFILLILFLSFTKTFTLESCVKWDDSYTDFLATKTPYRLIENKNDSKVKFDGCEAKKIWLIVRHGTRYPGSKLIKSVNMKLYSLKNDILSSYANGANALCSDVVKLFDRWYFGVNYRIKKNLAHEGEDEMVALGERYQKRFPGLFPKVYSSIYKFRSTKKQRTIESNKYFMIGLFGRNTVESVWPIENPMDMHIIRFYKLCPRWSRDVDKNPMSLLERLKYEGTEEWSIMKRNISARLGLEYVIDQETLHTMYQVCAFETSWHKDRKSPWCAVLTKQELAELELTEDLEYYHIDGYGYPLNYKQACPAIKDAIQHLTSEDGPTTSVSFTHSGTILKLLAHLGLYKDTSDAQRLSQTRKWRVGKIDAFASNLALVSFKCGDKLKFQFYHQEKPVPLGECPADGLCPIDVLLKTFEDSQNNCDFEGMCTLPLEEL